MNLTMTLTSSRDVTEMMVDYSKIYPLAMTNSLPWEMAHRNRGLPIKNGDFPWRTVSHKQMVL